MNSHITEPAAPVLPADIAAEEVRSEVQDYLDVRDQRRRIFPRALVTGLMVGVLAVLFRKGLAEGDAIRGEILAYAHHFPTFGWILPVVACGAAAALSVLLVRRLAPEAAGSGIPHLEAVLRRFRTLDGKRVLPVKFFGGLLALGSGMAMGREGPTVQMGAAAADLISGWLKANGRERRTLLSAGAGAGLAAAFNAPLAGLVFVLEEVQRDFRPIVFGAAFLAAAAADVVARFASGQLPVFKVTNYPVPDLSALPAFVVLGALAGLLGVGFNKGLLWTMNQFARFQVRAAWPIAAVVGGIVGLIGWFHPEALGGGHDIAEVAMEGKFVLTAIPIWFLLRFALTLCSYSTGAPGGVFAPMLALGALLGLAVGQIAAVIAPGTVAHPGLFAVVGMAAFFAAVVRAPLTGIVLIVEMTGNYALMVPLIVACFAAYAVAEGLHDRPIYEALLERDLARGGYVGPGAESGPVVLEFTVQPGSRFDGAPVRNLGLPAGCILVSGRNEDGDWVPNGGTILHADDRVTAVIDHEAGADGLRMLREGSETRGRN